MQLIIFDLDHTLISVNGSYCFGAYLYKQRFFSFLKLLPCLTDYACHKYLGMSVQNLHHKTFERLFKNQSLAIIREHVKKFLDKNLNSFLYQPVVQRLQQAQNEGHYIVILSSSPDFLVEEIAHYLRIQHWKGTTYHSNKEGYLIAIDEVVDGQDKAHYVTALAQQLQISTSAITVYSDSHLDLPVLKIAGKAIGVLPDRRLAKICHQKGWEII